MTYLLPSIASPRWRLVLAAGLICMDVTLPVTGPSWAQSAPVTAVGDTRNFPAKTKLGELVIDVFPEASLNGRAARFSASGRLINETNFIVLPSSVYQRKLTVRYELDFEGNIQRAWLLNAAELKIARDEAQQSP
jgi:hypothetical protein